MKKFTKFAIAYLALALIAAVFLAVSFFYPDNCSVINQISLLLQSVGFSFVGGMFFGGRV